MLCFSVGKTSLITRFMYDSFDNTYQVSVRNHDSLQICSRRLMFLTSIAGFKSAYNQYKAYLFLE